MVEKTPAGTPSHIYREMVEQSPSELTGPRNLKQISNAQNVARRKIRQTNDALYKVYEMANEARDTQDEFIRSIQVILLSLSAVLCVTNLTLVLPFRKNCRYHF